MVDDDPDIRLMVTWALRDEGYAVQTAVNGCDALQIMCDRMPDLVLLDLQMPVMDGWQVQSLLKKAAVSIPVVVMSAGMRAALAARAQQAAGYLAKPFDLNALYDTVGRFTQPAHA